MVNGKKFVCLVNVTGYKSNVRGRDEKYEKTSRARGQSPARPTYIVDTSCSLRDRDCKNCYSLFVRYNLDFYLS